MWSWLHVSSSAGHSLRPFPTELGVYKAQTNTLSAMQCPRSVGVHRNISLSAYCSCPCTYCTRRKRSLRPHGHCFRSRCGSSGIVTGQNWDVLSLYAKFCVTCVLTDIKHRYPDGSFAALKAVASRHTSQEICRQIRYGTEGDAEIAARGGGGGGGIPSRGNGGIRASALARLRTSSGSKLGHKAVRTEIPAEIHTPK